MSKVISYSVADARHVVAFVSGNPFTADQQRILGHIRKSAEAHQLDLDRQSIDYGLTIPEALDHLLAGRADADAMYAGNAYYSALQHIIDSHACDPYDLGVFSSPGRFFGLLDGELRRLGVPAELLPGTFLYAGPPEEIPFPIPSPVDGSPEIGRLPLTRAKPAADAYGAVMDRVDSGLRYELEQLAGILRTEHDEWQTALRHGWTMDTVFFSIKG
ncbi:hypothetical protein ABZY42_19670 [Streptomyces sp. NPDC006622]|uniref:DUF7691 family protein n=1 Tax=Streptomyces sp. NPDC006622 TaxID=3155459 RepID=UPI0033BB22A7